MEKNQILKRDIEVFIKGLTYKILQLFESKRKRAFKKIHFYFPWI